MFASVVSGIMKFAVGLKLCWCSELLDKIGLFIVCKPCLIQKPFHAVITL